MGIDSKAVLSLVSVVLGWLLGQGTVLVKDWRSNRRLRAGLLTELEDIREELRNVTLIHMRQLQVLAHNGIEPTYASPVHNFFFTHHYKDVLARLNREQRLSYQYVHAAIASLNTGNDEMARYLADLRDARQASGASQSDIANWGARVRSLYVQARTSVWFVENHLANPKKPVLDNLGPVHVSFLKFQQELDGEVADLMQKAKSLKREDFAKVYDERAFRTRDLER